MPQFDVHPNPDAPGYLLDYQADALTDFSTRLIVPLQPPAIAPKPAGRLNPTFDIGAERLSDGHAVRRGDAGARPPSAVTTLRAREYGVIGALGLLLTGV